MKETEEVNMNDMKIKTKILVELDEDLNDGIDNLQRLERKMNQGKPMRNKAEQVARLAAIGLVEMNARPSQEPDRG